MCSQQMCPLSLNIATVGFLGDEYYFSHILTFSYGKVILPLMHKILINGSQSLKLINAKYANIHAHTYKRHSHIIYIVLEVCTYNH